MNKTWQFTESYLNYCKKMSSSEIISYLEDQNKIHFKLDNLDFKSNTQKEDYLISLKINAEFLSEFKKKCLAKNIKYQTQIKILMKEWLKSNS